MVTGVPGTPSRLIAPILQTSNNITRLPVAQNRPPATQVANISQPSQAGRSSTQAIQVNLSSNTSRNNI